MPSSSKSHNIARDRAFLLLDGHSSVGHPSPWVDSRGWDRARSPQGHSVGGPDVAAGDEWVLIAGGAASRQGAATQVDSSRTDVLGKVFRCPEVAVAKVAEQERTSPRWMGVGHSNEGDAHRAGASAAREALVGASPQLIVVFTSRAYDLHALLAGINDVAGAVPLIGCSTAGEIAASGPRDASVVVTALGGEGFSVAVGCATSASSGLREAGAEVASCLEEVDERPHKVLLILTDGLAGDQQEIVRGAHGVVGSGVPLVGGCAGDDLKLTSTSQLFGDRVLEDAVVAAAVSSDAPFGIGVRHGWRKIGEPMLVTRSLANRVYSLDDMPALDVYLERLGAPPEAWRDHSAFTDFSMTHPLGLSRRSGEPQVRFVSDADFVERSIGCIAEIPEGGVTWFMEGDADSVLRATDAACADALVPLESKPLGMIAFDCIARRGVLGEAGIKNEIDRMSSHAAAAPVAGFYTYGEIARTRGVSGFHNQTLVVLALS